MAEGLSFEADIVIDGQKAGHASNDGNGGSNLYMFDDQDAALVFDLAAGRWGAKHNVPGDAADLFFASLAQEQELAEEASELLASGYCTVIYVQKTPGRWGDDSSGKPDFYEDGFLLGLYPEHDPATAAAVEGAETWSVIATAESA